MINDPIDNKENFTTEEGFVADKPLNQQDDRQTPPPTCDAIAKRCRVPEGYVVIASDTWQSALKDKEWCNDFNGFLKPLLQRYGTIHVIGEALTRMLEAEAEPTDFNEKWLKNPRRKIGRLSSPPDIRAEMASLYRESYQHGVDGSRYFTRLIYMLDCLMRAAQAEQKSVQKAPASATKRSKSQTGDVTQAEPANDGVDVR